MSVRAIAHRVCSVLGGEKRSRCYSLMTRALSGDRSALEELRLELSPEERSRVRDKLAEVLRELEGGG